VLKGKMRQGTQNKKYTPAVMLSAQGHFQIHMLPSDAASMPCINTYVMARSGPSSTAGKQRQQQQQQQGESGRQQR
jgi:hypothetical protein